MDQTVLGIDVSKKKFDIALLISGKIKNKGFTNSKEGFKSLLEWLVRHNVHKVHACLEATGTYGEGLAEFLYEAGHTVSIVNPARIRGFAQSELIRTKNDRVDAGLIARFCEAMRPAPWTPAAPEIKRLQALVRRMDALVGMRTQELNRLDIANFAVGKSIRDHIAYLDQEIAKVKELMREGINKDPDLRKKRDLLVTIPGIGETTVSIVLAELNAFRTFDTIQQVVAFVGLVPKEKESGSSVKGRPRICKIGSARVRTALYMPALVAIRHNPVILAFHARLKAKGKNGKVIVCAIMKKLLHIMFGILKNNKPFMPDFPAVTP